MDANLPPSDSGEWHHLNGFLDHLRHTVESQAIGLGDADLARKVGTVSIGGILTHLAFIEDYWFGYVWTGRGPSEPWVSAPWDDDADADWGMATGRSGREILALWRAAVDRSRREAVRSPLDGVSARHRGRAGREAVDPPPHDRGVRPPRGAGGHAARPRGAQERVRFLDQSRDGSARVNRFRGGPRHRIGGAWGKGTPVRAWQR